MNIRNKEKINLHFQDWNILVAIGIKFSIYLWAIIGKNLIYHAALLFLFIGLTGGLNACSTPSKPIQHATDTIIPSKNDYQGYRLQLTNIQVEKKKGNQRKIKCTLINTGREKVRLPLKSSSSPNIVVQYDNSLENNGLTAYKNSLERALHQKKFVLDVGKIASNFELKFNISKEQLAQNEAKEKRATKTKNNNPPRPVNTNIYDKSYCADLKIDTVFILKRSKKTVELAFKITNYGKGPAAMFGETTATEDNVAIRAFASGTPKLSRGDLVLGGAFIEGGMEDQNGVLMPNESFSGSFEVETRKKTRYMPYFILSIDDYQSLWECDERNNVMPLLDRR